MSRSRSTSSASPPDRSEGAGFMGHSHCVPGRRRIRPWMVIAVVLAATGVSYAAADTGVIGPSNGIQPSGRLLDPVGKMTQLGNFPTGGALTTNGRFLWTLSTGRDHNDIRIVRVSSNRRCRLHGKGKAAHKRLK